VQDSINILEWFVGALTALLGVIWKMLGGRVKKLEDEHMSRVMCELHGVACEQKIASIKDKLSELKTDNKSDHDDLILALKEIGEAIDKLQECVTKLSVGADCQ
jgi:3-methyladenine DNA glycosylase AlkD